MRNRNKAPVSATDMESHTCNAPLAAEEAAGHDTRWSIHIHSIRKRLCDPDGVSGKAAIDGLVHAGILANDTTKQVSQDTFSQEKIPKSQVEETIVTIEHEGGGM